MADEQVNVNTAPADSTQSSGKPSGGMLAGLINWIKGLFGKS